MTHFVSTLDRYIVRQFGINYLISFAVLVSIYVILDLFFNFDEFSQGTNLSFFQILWAMARYYGAHLFLYFAQISGVITLFAMAVTLARLQRDNEFIAIVSSGVSLYRIAVTVIMVAIALNCLWLVDQELIIPRLAPKLAQTHKAVALNQPYGVWFLRDKSEALLSAAWFDHQAGELGGVLVMNSKGRDDLPETIRADRATWAGLDRGESVWKLRRGERLFLVIDASGRVGTESEPAGVFRSSLTPDDIALRQSTQWIQFLSKSQLSDMRQQGISLSTDLAREIHGRFSAPIVNMLILIIGMPIFLNRQPPAQRDQTGFAGVVQSGARCLLTCGACFGFAFFSQNLVWGDYPALTAWMPLIVLTPVMVISLDRMKT